MTRTKYSQTTDTGDERLRGRFVGIRTDCNENPVIELLEHWVVRRADGSEKPIDEGPNLSFALPVKECLAGASDAVAFMEQLITRRDYITGIETGESITLIQAVNDFYSVLHQMQLKRDEAAALAAQPQESQP